MAFESDFNLRGGKTIALKQGEILFHEGSSADEMYFIERGTIKISKRVLNKSIKLGEGNAGDFISERAVLCEGLPRSTTASAQTDCEIVVINEKMCREYKESLPPFAKKMIQRMTTRLHHTNEMVVKMARTQEMVKDLVLRIHKLENSMMLGIEQS